VTERRYRTPAYNLGESHASVLLHLIVISRSCCNDGHLGFRRLVRPRPTMTVRMDEDNDSTLDLKACPKCSSQMRLFAIEWEGKRRDIYTFVCDLCGHTAARRV
jgi:hypothetical protein